METERDKAEGAPAEAAAGRSWPEGQARGPARRAGGGRALRRIRPLDRPRRPNPAMSNRAACASAATGGSSYPPTCAPRWRWTGAAR